MSPGTASQGRVRCPPSAAPDRSAGPSGSALIEDHHLVREGLRLVLTTNGFDVVGECPSVQGAFDLLERHRPDVVLLDLSLADGDGVALLREMHARSPDTRIVVVTMHRDAETVRQALLAGADGYVVKGAHSIDLVDAIQAVMRGERYLHSSVTSVVVDDSIRWLQSGGVLTVREREILGLARQRPRGRGYRAPPRDQPAHGPASCREPVGEARDPRHRRPGPLRCPRGARPGDRDLARSSPSSHDGRRPTGANLPPPRPISPPRGDERSRDRPARTSLPKPR